MCTYFFYFVLQKMADSTTQNDTLIEEGMQVEEQTEENIEGNIMVYKPF